MHCLILTAMALFKHQILKIHPSMITSDSFILSKMLLKQWEKKEVGKQQQNFHCKNPVWNIKSESKLIPYNNCTSFL